MIVGGVVFLVMFESWGMAGLAAAVLLEVFIIALWVLGLRMRR